MVLLFWVGSSLTTIAIPQTITVSRGNCEGSFAISVSGVQQQLVIQITPNSLPQDFYATSNVLTYGPGNSSQTVSFCASSNISAGTVPIAVSMMGPDSGQFVLTNNQIVAQITGGSTNNNTNNTFVTTPTISATPSSVQSNSVTYSVTTNSAGTVYYSVASANSSTPTMSEPAIKNAVLTGNLQPGMNTSQGWISAGDSYIRVGSSQAANGTSSILVSGLNSSSTYTVCMYLETSSTVYSSPSCSNVSTTTTPAGKATFVFNRALSPAELNRFLCYLSSATNITEGSIVTSAGESCNRIDGSAPRNFYYNYAGTTVRGTNSTVVYVLSNGTNGQAATNNFANLFTSGNAGANLTSSASYAAGSSIGNGASITNSTYNGLVNTNDIIYSQVYSTNGIANVVGTNSSVANTLGTAISTSKTSTIYIVIVPVNDPPPSAEQVMNCRNGYNNTVTNCSRVVFGYAGVIASLLRVRQWCSPGWSAATPTGCTTWWPTSTRPVR